MLSLNVCIPIIAKTSFLEVAMIFGKVSTPHSKLRKNYNILVEISIPRKPIQWFQCMHGPWYVWLSISIILCGDDSYLWWHRVFMMIWKCMYDLCTTQVSVYFCWCKCININIILRLIINIFIIAERFRRDFMRGLSRFNSLCIIHIHVFLLIIHVCLTILSKV